MNQERPYSKREMDILFQELRDSAVAFKEQLDRIETQTRLTNGRVGSLETWRYFVVGAVAVVAFLTPYLAQTVNSRLDRVQALLTEHITNTIVGK